MAKAKQKLKTPGDLFPDDMRPDFPGFRTAAFTFLSDLKRHNERAWFQSNRETYEREVRFPLECLVAELSDPAHQLPIRGDPKRNVFRGYRDVRFSKNKTPYKTHAAAYLTRDGVKGAPGVLYIHIEPGNCRLGAGFFMPNSALLLRWRQRMIADPESFLELVTSYGKQKAVSLGSHRELKTMPRGFKEHADTPIGPYLRWKNFLLSRKITDAQASHRAFAKTTLAFARQAQPLLKFGWAL